MADAFASRVRKNPSKKALPKTYLRVSTIDQTTANQERELREIAGRMGCEIVKVYKDHLGCVCRRHACGRSRGRPLRPLSNYVAECRDAEGVSAPAAAARSPERHAALPHTRNG